MDTEGGHYFKGVMLCNRPAPAVPVKTSFEPQYERHAEPFVSTVTQAEQLGINPVPKQLPPRQKKDENDDVTHQHKKFLAEFQQRRNELVELMEDTQVKNEEKKARFQAKQAEMRAKIRQVREEKPGDADAIAAVLSANREMKHDFMGEKKTAKAKKGKSKPKWAMTAEENEQDREIEVDDLLAFTDELDFDQYIDDLEVKEALSFVQDRVKTLQMSAPKEVPEGEEEFGEGDEEDDDFATLDDAGTEKRLRRRGKKKKAEGDWENESVAESVASDTSNMSKALLANNRSMKGVHSQASVQAMLEKEKQSLAVTEPRIVQSNPRHANVAESDPSNLPYLHRSPAM